MYVRVALRQVVSVALGQKPPPVKNLLDEDREELLARMFAALLHADRLPQVLAVRKGRVRTTLYTLHSYILHTWE